MQKTPLFEEYAAYGAKVVDFHGWALPIHFAGIIQEHLHTRSKAGLFDCSHMGEFIIRGAAGIQAFDRLVFGDMTGLPPGRCRYTGILNEQGGIVDDCVALRLNDEELYVITNAGPLEKVAAHILEHVPGAINVSDGTAKLDVQGPQSRKVLLECGFAGIAPLKYWTGRRAPWRGAKIIVTRAGYTGELGYELFLPAEMAVDAWRVLLRHPDVTPCGLGARDTLRTEMGYPLNGEDVTEVKTPLEGGMERFIDWNSEFVGKAALEVLRARGGYSRLTGIKSADRRAPRHGFDVKLQGRVVGRVTSGTYGPSVNCGVGLADLLPEYARPGIRLTAGPRDLEIETVELPIYRGGTCRRKIV